MPIEVLELIKRFQAGRDAYRQSSYLEASLRVDFLDPLFKALGWDVSNKRGVAEHLREVVVESRLSIDGTKKSPDYAFRVGGRNKFFIEAKKPHVDIEHDPAPARQVRIYGWNGKVTYSILTDFEGISVYDTRIQPLASDSARVALIRHIPIEQYADEWDWISERFSREAVLAGRLDELASSEKVARGTIPVDDAILMAIRHWRDMLADSVHLSNPDLDAYEISVGVQLLIDRMLFLRIAEDRGLEPEKSLLSIAHHRDGYARLIDAFKLADNRYNSGLFHLYGRDSDRIDKLTPTFKIDSSVLQEIVGSMYWPRTAFNFRILGAPILGNVYEQFLGEVLSIGADDRVHSTEKPEVKKAGGVVYTPESVVEYMLEKTLTQRLSGQTIEKVTGVSRANFSHPLRVLDPACGSGSFLIVAYQKLLDWFLERYSEQPSKWLGGSHPRLFEAEGGELRLTTSERKRILLGHVYGVDVDYQAVEVTKLSLLLKVLEDEQLEDSEENNFIFRHERVLPDLDKNVRCGNSLVDKKYYGLEPSITADVERARKINPFTWDDEFPEVFKVPRPGFDVVVGNPPYVVLQDEFRDDHLGDYLRANYSVAAYKLDLYHIFMERAAELVREDGYYAFITPSNWLTNNYMVGLRRFMLARTQLTEVNVLDHAVFPKRSVDCAIFVARMAMAGTELFEFKRSVAEPVRGTLQAVQTSELEGHEIRKSSHALITGGGGDDLTGALDKMLASGVPLRRRALVNFGKQLRDRKVFPGDVVKNSLNDAPGEGYARCYTGSDVTPWRVFWSGIWCLDDVVARRGGTWDAKAQNAMDKLLCRQVGKFPVFGIDVNGYQCLNTIFMVNAHDGVSPWFLMGVLNSLPIRAFWLERFWDRRNIFPKIKGTYLKEIPIPVEHDHEVERLARVLVETVAALADAPPSRVEHLERAIEGVQRGLDERVCSLFGLSGEEMVLLSDRVDELVTRG